MVMNWMDILARYANLGPGHQSPDASVHFEQVANASPRADVAGGLADAFRAEETPELEHMVGQLFDRSDPQQRAGLLNELLRFAGPNLIGALGGAIGNLVRRDGARAEVSPDDAASVPRQEVEDLARKAAHHDANVIDRIGSFYAKHPALVQTLGNAVLSIALSRMAQRRAA
jgi:hypothetical protein